jgi:hypothetical protein
MLFRMFPLRPAMTWAALLFVFFTALYISVSPSLAYQHWDSLEYSYSCETRGPLATWGNHPLGQFIQCSVYTIARAAGVTGRALPILKIASGVFFAGAVAVFFLVMVRAIGVSTARALGWSLVLGGAYGVWHYAGTADIYGISLVTLVYAWYLVLQSTADRRRPAEWLTVAALVIAALVHQYNVIMLACGMVGLAIFRPEDRRRLLRLAIWSMAIATVGFFVLGVYSLPSHSALRVYRWIIGYGGDPTYGHSFGLRGLLPGLHSISETFLRDPYLDQPRVLWGAMVLLGMLLFLAGLRRGPQAAADRPILAASMLQLVVGWALIVWWWPLMAGKWWIQTLPFLIIWWDRGLEWLIDRAPIVARPAAWAPALAGVFTVIFNFSVAMRTERQPDVAFEQGLAQWVKRSAPEDVLIENGRLTAHLIFWSDRPNAMNVYRVLQIGARAGDPLGAVRRVIDTAIGDGHQVLFATGLDPYFFTDDLLSLVGVTRNSLEGCFNAYRREGPVFSYQEWPASPPTDVYRLLRPAARPQ